MAVATASKYVSSAKNFIKNVAKNIEFDVIIPDDVMLGSDFEVTVTAKNVGSTTHHVPISITGSTIYYTGVKKAQVAASKRTVTVKPGQSK